MLTSHVQNQKNILWKNKDEINKLATEIFGQFLSLAFPQIS